MQQIINRITKNDVDLIFTKDKVYKLILDTKLRTEDLNEIPLLDSLANIKPVIVSMNVSEDFKDFWPNIKNTPVMVMRNLDSTDCLKEETNLKQFIEPLGIYISNFHSKCPTESNQPRDYLYKRMHEDLNQVGKLPHIHKDISVIVEKISLELINLRGFIMDRADIGYIKQIHGDINLEHLFKEDDAFCLIDFYLRKKYRVDDPTRDIATLFIDLYEHGNGKLTSLLLSIYCTNGLIRRLTLLQVMKRLLMKYFVYSGGYAPTHYDKDKLADSMRLLKTITKEYF